MENIIIRSTLLSKHFFGISDDEMNDTIYTFWIYYTAFNYNNGVFGCDYFTWIIKDICEVNIHIWHHNYSLTRTKLLGFVACRIKSNIIVIGSSGRSWVGVKTIKSGNSYYISSDE